MEENHGLIYEGLLARSPMVGALAPLDVLRINGDWTDLLPDFERQSRDSHPNEEPIDVMLESMNCVQFSFLSILEMLAKRYGRTLNLSDRFLYWASGCTVRGNTFGNCFYGFMSHGAPAEAIWPWIVAMSREAYGKEPPDFVKAEALALFDTWNIGLLRYVPSRIEDMKEALKHSPLWFCNNVHAMVIYKIDDRIRVFDTYPGPTGNGRASFGLGYAPNILACYNIQFGPKFLPVPTPMPNVILPENCFVTGIFPHEQRVALHVNGKLMMGDDLIVLKMWFARNENPASHRFEGGPERTISENDWNSFPHVNFKGEPLP